MCLESEDVISVEELEEKYKTDDSLIILLVVKNPDVSLEIHQSLKFASVNRIVDVFNPSCFFNPWNRFSEEFITKNSKHHVTECIEREIYYNKIEGAVAEAGVFKGNTARRINYLFPDRTLYLFDTFEGFLPEEQELDDKRGFHNEKIDFTMTSVELVLSKMPFLQNVIIKKGWFPESAMDIN